MLGIMARFLEVSCKLSLNVHARIQVKCYKYQQNLQSRDDTRGDFLLTCCHRCRTQRRVALWCFTDCWGCWPWLGLWWPPWAEWPANCVWSVPLTTTTTRTCPAMHWWAICWHSPSPSSLLQSSLFSWVHPPPQTGANLSSHLNETLFVPPKTGTFPPLLLLLLN